MSEYDTIQKGLIASEAFVSPETGTYTDNVCAKEVRMTATSGSVTCIAKYVASDFINEAHNDEFTIATLTGTEVRQLFNAGKYRFEIANKSDINPAGIGIVASFSDNVTKRPLIKRGMIKRYMSGIIRRSA